MRKGEYLKYLDLICRTTQNFSQLFSFTQSSSIVYSRILCKCLVLPNYFRKSLKNFKAKKELKAQLLTHNENKKGNNKEKQELIIKIRYHHVQMIKNSSLTGYYPLQILLSLIENRCKIEFKNTKKYKFLFGLSQIISQILLFFYIVSDSILCLIFYRNLLTRRWALKTLNKGENEMDKIQVQIDLLKSHFIDHMLNMITIITNLYHTTNPSNSSTSFFVFISCFIRIYISHIIKSKNLSQLHILHYLSSSRIESKDPQKTLKCINLVNDYIN